MAQAIAVLGMRPPGYVQYHWRRSKAIQYYAATYENVVSGKYPMSRALLVYINRAPGQPLDPLVREFAKFIMSKEGQEVVIKDGYYPLPAAVVNEELKNLQ